MNHLFSDASRTQGRFPLCPCWVPPPTNHTNDKWDFVRTITWFIRRGGLIAGDVLVLDLAGVRLIFLPAYSPELNPCELVFGHVKQGMTGGRGVGGACGRKLLNDSLLSQWSKWTRGIGTALCPSYDENSWSRQRCPATASCNYINTMNLGVVPILSYY